MIGYYPIYDIPVQPIEPGYGPVIKKVDVERRGAEGIGAMDVVKREMERRYGKSLVWQLDPASETYRLRAAEKPK